MLVGNSLNKCPDSKSLEKLPLTKKDDNVIILIVGNIHEKVKKKLLKARLKLNMNVVKNALNEWYLGVGIELYECRYSILFNLDYFIYINEIQH